MAFSSSRAFALLAQRRLPESGMSEQDLHLLLLQLFFKASGIELHEEIASLNQRALGDHGQNVERSVTSSSLTTDLNVFATLNFPLVEDLGNELPFNHGFRDWLDKVRFLGRRENVIPGDTDQCYSNDPHQNEGSS